MASVAVGMGVLWAGRGMAVEVNKPSENVAV